MALVVNYGPPEPGRFIVAVVVTDRKGQTGVMRLGRAHPSASAAFNAAKAGLDRSLSALAAVVFGWNQDAEIEETDMVVDRPLRSRVVGA